MVGMVVTISPSFSLYNIVVLPAASSPTVTQIKIEIMFVNNKNIFRINQSYTISVQLYQIYTTAENNCMLTIKLTLNNTIQEQISQYL